MEIIAKTQNGQIKYSAFRVRQEYCKFLVRDKFGQEFFVEYEQDTKQWVGSIDNKPEDTYEAIGNSIIGAFNLEF